MSSIIFNNNSSSPAVAGAGKAQIYAKSDGKVYKQVASNTEIEISDLTLTTVSTAPELSANKASAKAWTLFDGTDTSSISGSFNVSTVTDNGTGDYTINFATALADVGYAVAGTMDTENTSGTRGANGIMNHTAEPGSVRIQCMYGSTNASNGALMDSARTSVIVFGN